MRKDRGQRNLFQLTSLIADLYEGMRGGECVYECIVRVRIRMGCRCRSSWSRMLLSKPIRRQRVCGETQKGRDCGKQWRQQEKHEETKQHGAQSVKAGIK